MPSPPPPRILDPTALRVVWTVLVVIGALVLLYLLRTVLLVLAFAVVFAYLIFPLVKVVERGLPRSGRRPVAIGAVYVVLDRKSTRLNSSHVAISYAVFC